MSDPSPRRGDVWLARLDKVRPVVVLEHARKTKPLMTARNFLIHGLIAGFLAGVAAFLVAHQVGEPNVNAAIAYTLRGIT